VPRLALVGPSWPYRGGISRTTTHLAAALERRGTLAAFLTASRQYPRFLYPGSRDIDPMACPRLAVAQPCFGVLQPMSWRNLMRKVAAAAPDAVVMPFWTSAWAPMTSWLIHGRLAPVVGIVHNPADHDASWPTRMVAHRVLAGFGGFLCHARAVELSLREGFPEKPVAVHPLAPDEPVRVDREAARRALGVPTGAVAFLSFGLIRPYKGVDVLVGAIASLPPGTPSVLLLAGEPWAGLDDETGRRLASLTASGRAITRLEWIPEEEVATWLGAADVMVLPYRSATGSAVAAQALGYGLPVIASRVGGLAEVVRDGENGLLVPPGDPIALGVAMQALLDPHRREAMADASRAAAAALSWDSYAAALERLVDRIIGRWRPDATS
jgi:glycosyltransferase involved in cell wall biosynthesis